MAKKYFTEKQYKELLSSIVVLVDSREQENSTILEWFDSKKIKYETKKLDVGDYSFKVVANPTLGIITDDYYVDELTIEKKNSLDELAGNMTEPRFRAEAFNMSKIKLTYLLIENDSFSDIINHKYRSQYDEKAFMGTLLRWSQKYNIHIQFIDKKHTAYLIWNIITAYLRSTILTSS